MTNNNILHAICGSNLLNNGSVSYNRPFLYESRNSLKLIACDTTSGGLLREPASWLKYVTQWEQNIFLKLARFKSTAFILFLLTPIKTRGCSQSSELRRKVIDWVSAENKRSWLTHLFTMSTCSSNAVVVALTEKDTCIPGTKLDEPFDSYMIPGLKWWLLCRVSGLLHCGRNSN